jgi:anti-anti-sigma factor
VSFATGDPNGVAVHLQGEHDAASIDELGEVLARAIALDDRAVIVDLSRVDFMSTATVGVLLRARTFMNARGRSLEIRSPSECAQRTLAMCGASSLFDESKVLAREGP